MGKPELSKEKNVASRAMMLRRVEYRYVARSFAFHSPRRVWICLSSVQHFLAVFKTTNEL